MINRKTIFWKLLGCGRKGTFDIHPDWRQWGLLVVNRQSSIVNEESKEMPTSAIRHPTSGIRHQISAISHRTSAIIEWWWKIFRCEKFTIVLQPIEGYGTWDGKEVFGPLPKQTEYEGMTAVLTRATIRIRKLKSFWKNVDRVAMQLNNAKGFLMSFGIGELPWIKQATFSVWRSKADMLQFAYKTREHEEVIRKTRNEGWYREEMFVRFIPLAAYGSINGKNPLEGMS